MAPFLYDYELEVGEPQMDGTVEFTVKVLANENTKIFGDLIITNVDVHDDCLRCWIKTEEFNYFGVGIARQEMQRGKPVESGTTEEG